LDSSVLHVPPAKRFVNEQDKEWLTSDKPRAIAQWLIIRIVIGTKRGLTMLAGMRRILILQREARSDHTNELGADFMAAPPDHLVSAFPDNTVAGQEQYELIGNVESRDMKLHAVVGNVD
jgi:hypothetical protein